MSKYDRVRADLDEFIAEVSSDNELYSLAISTRLILPRDNTPDAEAKVLLRQCLSMVSELWELMEGRGFPRRASQLLENVERRLDDSYASIYVEG